MQTCPNCGFQNRPGTMICDNCGTSLIQTSTRMLGSVEELRQVGLPASEGQIADDYGVIGAEEFFAGTTLRLEVAEGGGSLEVPYKALLVLGRRDPSTGLKPDVDLTPFAGYRMGVSRRHAELRHTPDENKLELWDLGSSNGTFVNEERLAPHRSQRLRNGDYIRLGQLGMRVFFQTKAAISAD